MTKKQENYKQPCVFFELLDKIEKIFIIIFGGYYAGKEGNTEKLQKLR